MTTLFERIARANAPVPPPPPVIPEWRRRALERAAKEGRLVAVKDTTGSVRL